MGLERCDAGRIELDGVDVTRLPMYKRARLGIGYLAQEASVFRKLTVEENLLAILEAVGVPPARRRERVDELLHEFGIEHVRHSYGYQLSGGERRRTEIARALAAEPSFLLLDEPFAGVDPIAVADLQEIIAHLKTKGLGLLITDHNVRETLAITDRAYIMHEGRILVEGDSKDIANDPVARKFYLGERFQL
jgi:ABC-type (unclassified) transport system, ATPase component